MKFGEFYQAIGPFAMEVLADSDREWGPALSAQDIEKLRPTQILEHLEKKLETMLERHDIQKISERYKMYDRHKGLLTRGCRNYAEELMPNIELVIRVASRPYIMPSPALFLQLG